MSARDMIILEFNKGLRPGHPVPEDLWNKAAERVIDAKDAEIERIRQAWEGPHHEIVRKLRERADNLAVECQAALHERNELRERVRELERINKAMMDSDAKWDGDQYRDRLERLSLPFMEKMFLAMKKTNPDLTVLEFLESVIREIDAAVEGRKP